MRRNAGTYTDVNIFSDRICSVSRQNKLLLFSTRQNEWI